ncbi:MAG: hypothetical protein AB3N63_10570 [Puniceicoccaceae bacterium]
MNRQRLVDILESYRPGEGLEADPEVRNALEQAAADPEIGEIHQQITEFDAAFAQKLKEVEVPSDLQDKILAAASHSQAQSPEPSVQRPISWWFHPAAFGAAATIVILLALTFTFTNRPAPTGDVAPLLTGDPIAATAQSLYSSLNPAFKSRDGSEVLAYLQSKGNGKIPVNLPGNVAWDESFACDVVEIDGNKVSIVCFRAPDNSRSMHLFTFRKADFPEVRVSANPQLRDDGDACCATWENDEMIHVLYSDKGRENLLAVLDI